MTLLHLSRLWLRLVLVLSWCQIRGILGQSSTSISISVNIPAPATETDGATPAPSVPAPPLQNDTATYLPPDTSNVTVVEATAIPTTATTLPPAIDLPSYYYDGTGVTVGVFYYPWTRHKFTIRDPPEAYLRSALVPQQMPILGNYDDTQPDVIQQHLTWSRQANVQVWFASWWGPGSRTDSTLQNTILMQLSDQHHLLTNGETAIQLAILYETREWLNDLTPDDMNNNDRSFGRVQSDMIYICQNYMHHSHYYHIDGKPVVYLYLSRQLHRRCGLARTIEYMRRGCDKELYIIGDHMWRDAPDDGEDMGLEHLDAIANYDIYGNLDQPVYAGLDKVHEYGVWNQNWKRYAARFNTSLVPGVTPGYNDRGHRLSRSPKPPMSRRLQEDQPEGSLMEAMLQASTPLVDPKAGNLLLVNSWNEWHEDTQIEPVDPNSGFTREPMDLTGNVEYRGYGTLYLDLLAKYTTNVSTPSLHLLQDNLLQDNNSLRRRRQNGPSAVRQEPAPEPEAEEWYPDWC